ncbi:PQQ-binding-like beta-propeller repeat protein [bacterium]|nr:PQQ-binding-like beta-propeller repeat protein [bacterium]
MNRFAFLVILAGLLSPLASSIAAEPWAQWRGPQGDGHVIDQSPPVKFSAKNVIWKTSLPGQGQSSPVVWDSSIFLTSALDSGRERIILSVNRDSGKIEWKEVVWTGVPEPSHQMNGWASATCTTDGEHVYAFFGRGGGLFCYSKDGKKIWSKNLGEFVGPWGTAACPILYENLVIQNCDSEANASLTAFDKLTGKVVWSTPREDFRGWSTPFLFKGLGEPQLVLNGHTGVRSYDPQTGKELWYCSSPVGRGEPTVTPDADGRLVVVNGLRGAVYAVSGKGTGDVSQTERLWQFPRKTDRDLPSPAIVGHHLLIMSMKGILTCCDTTKGQIVWEERVGGNYSASPVVLDKVALFVSESGEVVVIDPVAQEHVVARNSVGASDTEIFRSSLAADRDQWLLRSDKVLYCIGD